MPKESLTFDDLQGARQLHGGATAGGIELKLHADANQMAGLWGLMS